MERHLLKRAVKLVRIVPYIIVPRERENMQDQTNPQVSGM